MSGFANEDVWTPGEQVAEQNEQEKSSENNLVENDSQEEYAEPVESGRDYEAEAAATGRWKPKDEFKGDPANWKPAKEWLEGGDEIKRLRNEIARQRAELVAEIAEIRKERQQKNEEEISKLAPVKQKAFESGDYIAFEAAQKREQELINKVKQPEPQAIDQHTLETVKSASNDFNRRNAAWLSNREATEDVRSFVDFEMNKVANQRVPTPDDYHEVLKRAEGIFSAKYGQAKANAVASGTPRAPAKPEPKISRDDEAIFENLWKRGVYRGSKSKAEALQTFAKELNNPTHFVASGR